MSDFGKMVNEVASGTIGAYRAAMAEGYRRGQEEMRERAAKFTEEHTTEYTTSKVIRTGGLVGESQKNMAARIRALPLTDPEDK